MLKFKYSPKYSKG